MAYATVSDLTGFLPDGLDVPADASRMLDRATEKVQEILLTAVYDVDTSGMPTDPGVVSALRDATCAQAAWWIETGDEQGVAAALASASSGGGPSWAGQVPSVAPRAVTILRAAVDSQGQSILSGPWWR